MVADGSGANEEGQLAKPRSSRRAFLRKTGLGGVGAVGLFVAGEALLPAAAQASGTQTGWRYCNRCSGMFYGGVSGRCPATSGGHYGGGSYNYRIAWLHSPAENISTMQRGWIWCSKCSGLYYGGGSVNAPAGMCPTGGAHSTSGSYDYTLSVINRDGDDQRNWRYCVVCQGLFYPGNTVCPYHGQPHNPGGYPSASPPSAEYWLDFWGF